ncbi:TetR family transcriptional regulator [Frondihabitans sp. PAMC 28766]|uniref:TetR/AcrR family transcriptional regulator n=1 Tax=Frondihabitans sp. PAMC 28766 TaxID=1795630 RepID=UPI00078E7122|nr:TetR family transcriptional regulator [Frondihabitans sp. PAMC 28766]
MTRRDDIGDAGVRLIARNGVRALTHRGVDTEADLPPGSTTYYAKTRRDLTALVVDRLADYTQQDLEGLAFPSSLTPDEATRVAVGFLEHLSKRDDAQAVRFALLFELRDDDGMRAALTEQAPVRQLLVQAAEGVLHALHVVDSSLHARDLVALVDALLMYGTARAATFDAAAILGAYLSGLEREG